MAEAELQDAAAWYDERSPGLGLRFVLAVRKKSDEILEAPERWPLAAGSRRVLLGRFPYALVYREISADEIEIVAVAHLKRRVSYWSGR
jgi:plasmid stabilization system protein ParE